MKAEEVRHIATAASFGSPRAQVLLGQMHVDGAGVVRSRVEARHWFEKAAASGNLDGINMLGRCHELGWGGSVDLERAAAYYRRAAEAGHDWGQFNLASLLHEGRGLPKDRHWACAWFTRAARQGHPKAANMLGHYREEGWLHRRRPGAALWWFRRAANGGDFRGQFNLARHLYGMNQRELALVWLGRAIEGGMLDFWMDVSPVLLAHADPGVRRCGRRAAMLLDNVHARTMSRAS